MNLFRWALKDTIYEMPWFIHHVPLFHDWEDSRSHSKRSLFHMAVDLIFYRIQSWLTHHDALPIYTILKATLGFLWGLNCGFPARDVALYTAWYLRGCAPVKVWDKAELLETALWIEASQNAKNRLPDPIVTTVASTNWIEQLTTGIHRMSYRILDNLGLRVNVKIAYLIYSLRHDRSFRLTWEEERQAYTESIFRSL